MRAFAIALLCILALWLVGFLCFLSQLPGERPSATITTDAIIVLTGGNGRVEQGLNLLADGAAPMLVISGVGRSVTLPQMIAAHTSAAVRQRIAQQEARIVLDYVASTTQSNASEVARFAQANNLHSIRLITAYYHMPRSLLEFHAAMPDVDILPDAVLPDKAAAPWWKDEAARRLILREYHKYIAAFFLKIAPSN